MNESVISKSNPNRLALIPSLTMPTVASQIIRAYPSLEARVESLAGDHASEMMILAELASHVVDLFQTGHGDEVPPAFDLTEHLIQFGQEADRDAAILGFLEAIQNVASHRSLGASVFEQYLGPESRLAWAQLDEVWKGKNDLAEVLAAETGVRLRPRWWQFWRKRDRRTPKDLLSQVENPELRQILEQITRE
jgi:hypothetical protein